LVNLAHEECFQPFPLQLHICPRESTPSSSHAVHDQARTCTAALKVIDALAHAWLTMRWRCGSDRRHDWYCICRSVSKDKALEHFNAAARLTGRVLHQGRRSSPYKGKLLAPLICSSGTQKSECRKLLILWPVGGARFVHIWDMDESSPDGTLPWPMGERRSFPKLIIHGFGTMRTIAP
jgi:hypothetical protein